MWGNYCNMLHSLCSILPTSEVVETRFFVFLNMFYRRFPVWCMSWLTHKQANRFIRHKRYVYMSVCVCVCVCVVCVWVCECVCVYVHSPRMHHLSGIVGISGNRSTMLCWRHFFPPPSPFIATLEWSTEPF